MQITDIGIYRQIINYNQLMRRKRRSLKTEVTEDSEKKIVEGKEVLLKRQPKDGEMTDDTVTSMTQYDQRCVLRTAR